MLVTVIQDRLALTHISHHPNPVLACLLETVTVEGLALETVEVATHIVSKRATHFHTVDQTTVCVTEEGIWGENVIDCKKREAYL